jgi:hypothetical protein
VAVHPGLARITTVRSGDHQKATVRIHTSGHYSTGKINPPLSTDGRNQRITLEEQELRVARVLHPEPVVARGYDCAWLPDFHRALPGTSQNGVTSASGINRYHFLIPHVANHRSEVSAEGSKYGKLEFVLSGLMSVSPDEFNLAGPRAWMGSILHDADPEAVLDRRRVE